MLKLYPQEMWAFDAEWVPEPATGRRVYRLPAGMPDEEVLAHMWHEGGATEADPQPYLKTVLCRVVSIAAVIRKQQRDGTVSLVLHSLPTLADPDATEGQIIGRFLEAVGKSKPQLVGFNSHGADIPILVQRALVNGVPLPNFAKRPAKPWEGVDYFARGSDYNVDIKDEVGGFGKSTPSLHELATACRIPGKLGTAGDDVLRLWRAGDVRAIVHYNECDALTTYLVWLRLALGAGHVTPAQHAAEERQLEALLEQKASAGATHLREWLEAWHALRLG